MAEESKKKLRTRPYRADELFDIICGMIELPDILDYSIGDEEREVRNACWDFENHLDYGGNEGIYLDVYAGDIRLGLFKTLDTSDEAMRRMALLLADFIIAGNKFINSHLKDFTWDGYVVAREDDGRWLMTCQMLDAAVRTMMRLTAEGSKVRIIDARTRKDITDWEYTVKLLKEVENERDRIQGLR